MTRPDQQPSAREQLRAELVAAARREQEKLDAKPHKRKRRRRRRGIGLGVAILLGGAVAATATDLISTGDPVPTTGFSGPEYRPAVGAPELVATARDPERGERWGVGIYTGANGQPCVIAGQVRGNVLGIIRNGTFHPYRADARGACGNLQQQRMFTDDLTVRGDKPRTVLFGRARSTERSVVVESGGELHTAPLARGGAFIFVFRGNLTHEQMRIRQR